MRRLTLLAAILAVSAVAAPALAQERDPFEPLVGPTADGAGDPGAGGQGDGGTDDGEAGAGDGATDGDAAAPDGELPNTGVDPAPWLVLAYALIAAGVAALVLGRLFAPPSRRTP